MPISYFVALAVIEDLLSLIFNWKMVASPFLFPLPPPALPNSEDLDTSTWPSPSHPIQQPRCPFLQEIEPFKYQRIKWQIWQNLTCENAAKIAGNNLWIGKQFWQFTVAVDWHGLKKKSPTTPAALQCKVVWKHKFLLMKRTGLDAKN